MKKETAGRLDSCIVGARAVEDPKLRANSVAMRATERSNDLQQPSQIHAAHHHFSLKIYKSTKQKILPLIVVRKLLMPPIHSIHIDIHVVPIVVPIDTYSSH